MQPATFLLFYCTPSIKSNSENRVQWTTKYKTTKQQSFVMLQELPFNLKRLRFDHPKSLLLHPSTHLSKMRPILFVPLQSITWEYKNSLKLTELVPVFSFFLFFFFYYTPRINPISQNNNYTTQFMRQHASFNNFSFRQKDIITNGIGSPNFLYIFNHLSPSNFNHFKALTISIDD